MIPDNKYVLIILILGAGVACFLFADKIIEYIAYIITGGVVTGGAVAARNKSKKAVQEAEIYDDTRVTIDDKIIKEIDELKALHDESEESTNQKPEGNTDDFIDRARRGGY